MPPVASSPPAVAPPQTHQYQPPYGAPAQKKGPSTAVIVVGAILGLAVLGGIASALDPKKDETSNVASVETKPVAVASTPTAETAAEKKARLAQEKKDAAEQARLAAEAEPKWRTVKEFAGSSIKNTATFAITGDEWRIRWSTRQGKYGAMNFQIYVHDAETDSLKDLAANVIGEGSDETVIRGSGRYYLKFNTAQPYKAVVEEFR